jgi:hypothetical protein
MGRFKGFLAFALAAVFMAALALSSYSYRQNSGFDASKESAPLISRLQPVAIKQAAYFAFSDAASAALATAIAAEQEPRPAIRAALFARAILLDAELKASGYKIEFWCGSPLGSALSLSSSSMLLSGEPEIPLGAMPIGSPECASAFDVDMETMKIHISGLGFSLVSEKSGFAAVSRFPEGYEVDFK